MSGGPVKTAIAPSSQPLSPLRGQARAAETARRHSNVLTAAALQSLTLHSAQAQAASPNSQARRPSTAVGFIFPVSPTCAERPRAKTTEVTTCSSRDLRFQQQRSLVTCEPIFPNAACRAGTRSRSPSVVAVTPVGSVFLQQVCTPGSAGSVGSAGSASGIATQGSPVTAVTVVSSGIAASSPPRLFLPLPPRVGLASDPHSPGHAERAHQAQLTSIRPQVSPMQPAFTAATVAAAASGPRVLRSGRALPARLQALDDNTVLPREVYNRMLRIGEEARGRLGYAQHRLVFCGVDGAPVLRRTGVNG